MRVLMDEEDRIRLIRQVSEFLATAPGGTRRTLWEFQQLAGWMNWSFNVFPLLKPALSNVYEKIGGKTESHAKIFVSKAVIRDLDWFILHARKSDGIYLFEVVMGTGNPWIFFGLPVPVSVCTRTHVPWVQVSTGFPLGTGMGTVPPDVGMDLLNTYYIHTVSF
jgi:hypothetical protein